MKNTSKHMIIGRAIPESPNILPDISDDVKITAITAKQIPNTLKATFRVTFQKKNDIVRQTKPISEAISKNPSICSKILLTDNLHYEIILRMKQIISDLTYSYTFVTSYLPFLTPHFNRICLLLYPP